VQAGKEFDIMSEKLVNDWNKLEIRMSTVVKKVCVCKERKVCVFVCLSSCAHIVFAPEHGDCVSCRCSRRCSKCKISHIDSTCQA
jgi:hypothetical protein